MFSFIIINGASELMPQLHLFLARNGLSVAYSDVTAAVTIAEKKDEVKEIQIEKSNMREMIREIQAILRKYSSIST